MNKIYVNHIPLDYDITRVKQLFAEFGNVVDINYPVDKKTKKTKGYAFLTFETPEAAQEALKIGGREIDGKTLVVEFAKENSKKANVGKNQDNPFYQRK